MRKPQRKPKQDDDEQVDDVMAWGKSKQNYYQQSEEEYSEASQEQNQAKQIYENQLQELNRDDYYQVPEVDGEVDEGEEEEVQGEINQEYICYEILWVTELAKLFSGIHDDKSELRKKIYDSYLLILMALKQFKIPYIDQHPLVSNFPFLKKALQHFQKQLPTIYEKMHDNEDANGIEDGLQQEDGQNYGEDEQNPQSMQEEVNDEIEAYQMPKPKAKKGKLDQSTLEGLEIYEKIKKQKDEERKAKKNENKRSREQSRPKEAFRVVSENEGRLANQKILKNKGLMKRRRRDDGNSRTKLRHKYEKALVRRRAKGPIGVKQNPGRFYEGEDKVLYGKIASTKLN